MTRVVWLLAAVLAAGAVGASAEGGAAQPAQVCALLPSTTVARWERLDRRYLAAAFTAAGVEYTGTVSGSSMAGSSKKGSWEASKTGS